MNTLNAMIGCLERGGCTVVPGLPENQYQLTLLTSLIGGCVFGYATTIKPQGQPFDGNISPSSYSNAVECCLDLEFDVGTVYANNTTWLLYF